MTDLIEKTFEYRDIYKKYTYGAFRYAIEKRGRQEGSREIKQRRWKCDYGAEWLEQDK